MIVQSKQRKGDYYSKRIDNSQPRNRKGNYRNEKIWHGYG